MVKTFSPAQLSRHFERLEENLLLRAAESGVSKGAKATLRRVRTSIGTYLNTPGVADMPMADLAPSTEEDRIRAGYTPDEPGLREYGPNGMRFTYRMGTKRRGLWHAVGSVWSTDVRAVVFELGRINGATYQPPRRVLAASVVHETPRVLSQIAKALYTVQITGTPGRIVEDSIEDGGDT